ncbi:MAG: hypothetical protein GQ570_11715 [Helicobacteraceae bacterium]|nr:hypothetical protein [Helicobacteraceae bacterium]
MKIFALGLILATLALSGCVGDVYKLGKTIVITNSDILDNKTLIKLHILNKNVDALKK